MKKSIIFFAAIAAFFSCSKENPVNEIPTEETFSVELFATAPSGDADTKTTLVDGDGTKFVHWSKGDAIKVLFFPGRHSNAITGPSGIFASHFDEESSASANFRIDNWSFGMDQSLTDDRLFAKGIAVYPSSANASSSKASGSYTSNVSDVSFTLPSEQNAIENNIESNLNFSYSDVDLTSFVNTINNPSHQTKLEFKNVCALIQLTMPAQMPKVTEIALTSNDKVALTGHGSMNYTTGLNQEVNGTVTVTDGGNVVLKNADGFKAGATYYAVVWPGTHNSGLTIEFKAEDGTVATKTTPAVTLTASKVKPYTFNRGLDFIAPVQDFNYIYADGTTGNDVKSNIVGVIIFHGNPKEKFNNSEMGDKFKGLAIGLKDYMVYWGSSSTAPNWQYPSAVGLAKISVESYDVGGFNTKNIWITNKYSLDIYKTDYGTLPESATLWYIPAPIEWKYIVENLSKINANLSAAGGQAINLGSSTSDGYWLPLAQKGQYNAYLVHGPESSVNYQNYDWTYKYSTHKVRPIFAF